MIECRSERSIYGKNNNNNNRCRMPPYYDYYYFLLYLVHIGHRENTISTIGKQRLHCYNDNICIIISVLLL